MAVVKPFKAIRPAAALAEKVAALPFELAQVRIIHDLVVTITVRMSLCLVSARMVGITCKWEMP